MNRITITLTEAQAWHITNTYEDPFIVQNSDYPKSDPGNAFAQRIANKIRKALAKAKS